MSWIRPVEEKMQTVIEHLKNALNQIRGGRGQTALLDSVNVTYYGTPTPLRSIASIGVQGNQIVVQPFDRNSLGDIELAIREAQLGVNPINDGAFVRVVLPPPTEERRAQLKKMAHDRAEEARISLRGVRKDAWEVEQERKRRAELTEDDLYRGEADLNKLIDQYNDQVADLVAAKEKELSQP